MEIQSKRGVVLGVLACLLVTFLLFSPHLWVMRDYFQGRIGGDRARDFLLQCEQPFRRDIEPALMWRRLPPLVCNLLGLGGKLPLLVPYLGIVVLSIHVAFLLRSHLPDRRYVFGGTLLFTTTSGVLFPLDILGINDAWVWWAQLAVAFGRGRWILPVACLLAPWVDERFIIGLPVALLARSLHRNEPEFPWRGMLFAGLWLVPYAITRILYSFDAHAAHGTHFFLDYVVRSFPATVPWAPLGWWMGLRAGWVPVLYAMNERRWLLGGVAAATAIVMLLLAADISRSIAILGPFMLLGLFIFARRSPDLAPRAALWLAGCNLILPAGHVIGAALQPISSLPIELLRLIRIP
jgi:hypothetical protein